jgi:hypothetical protein
VTSTCDIYREATRKEIEELRRLAILDLEGAGYTSPPEQAIVSRLNTLAAEKHLLLPGQVTPVKAVRRATDKFSPGLALIQGFCQEESHKADARASKKRKGQPDPKDPSKVPCFFAALPDEYIDHFAKYLPASADLALWVLWRYSKTQMQTWVSQDTIREKSGVSENTIKRDLGLLRECNIVLRTYAGGRDFAGNLIRKSQGYKYRINCPLAWDRERVKQLKWKKGRRRVSCG